MAIETELKLRITPQHLAKLKRHALLKEHQLARPVTRRLYNVYFDTPELDLHKSAMALRLRRQGKAWLQTLKGGGAIKAGLHERNEWEFPVAGEALDFSNPLAADWDELLPIAWREKLQPVFVTDFSRSSRIVSWRGAHIEVCMDHGEIKAGDSVREICELELELKSGSPRQLFELALAILDIAPFEIEVVNKAEYGFRLLGDFVEQPYKSEPPKLFRQDTLAQGMRTLIWSCLLHLQKNWRGALADHDADFLHQVRVAFRRLRVLLHLMQQLRNDETLDRLSAEIADLSVLLGRIRDWDVFMAQTLATMLDAEGLSVASAARRAACYAVLHEQTREMQSLMLRFAIWMNGDYWTRLDMHAPQAQDFAAHRLNKLAHRFALSVAHLDEADAGQLHELRILAKKLRYSAESFSGWFDNKHTDRFLSALALVQQVLGLINDAAVGHRLLKQMTQDDERHEEAARRVQERLAHDLRLHHAALRHALKHFNKQAIFWRA
jgi:triphosphatase